MRSLERPLAWPRSAAPSADPPAALRAPSRDRSPALVASGRPRSHSIECSRQPSGRLARGAESPLSRRRAGERQRGPGKRRDGAWRTEAERRCARALRERDPPFGAAVAAPRFPSLARGLPVEFRPQIGRGYPLNLSISISGGKETNQDSRSNGE